MATDLAVETLGLSKRYGEATAVDNLDLSVRRGEVYGFLGPNGAGKTTTLKMLLGLVRPTLGFASVLGAEPGSSESLRRVGALVEAPTFYPYLSGWDNLCGIARLCGVPDRRVRVDGALRRVGLARRAGDRFRKYSTGMKLRLGIAAALLKDPELLVLDEPTNGLDPRGMAGIRGLIHALGDEGRTILLSSHLMPEVEQVCDRVGVIRQGRLVAEGSVSDLRGAGGLLVRAEPREMAAEIAGGIPGVEDVAFEAGSLRLVADPDLAPTVARELVSSGVRLAELRPARRSLEEAFFELTGDREEG